MYIHMYMYMGGTCSCSHTHTPLSTSCMCTHTPTPRVILHTQTHAAPLIYRIAYIHLYLAVHTQICTQYSLSLHTYICRHIHTQSERELFTHIVLSLALSLQIYMQRERESTHAMLSHTFPVILCSPTPYTCIISGVQKCMRVYIFFFMDIHMQSVSEFFLHTHTILSLSIQMHIYIYTHIQRNYAHIILYIHIYICNQRAAYTHTLFSRHIYRQLFSHIILLALAVCIHIYA